MMVYNVILLNQEIEFDVIIYLILQFVNSNAAKKRSYPFLNFRKCKLYTIALQNDVCYMFSNVCEKYLVLI